MNVFDATAQDMHFTPEENIVTSTTDGPAQPDAPNSLMQHVHADMTGLHAGLSGLWHRASRALTVVEQIAVNPEVDALTDAALAALRAGVAREVFDAVTDALRSAAAKKTGPNPVALAPEVAAHIASTDPAAPADLPQRKPDAEPPTAMTDVPAPAAGNATADPGTAANGTA